ncbi:acetolactate synthase [bacterium]|nr:acetolactate synthase [bacterium]
MRVEQISVLLRNEPGVLKKILESISEGDINILGLTINETAAFGELRLVVNDTKKARDILKKMDLSHNVVKVIVVDLQDKPGKLLEIARLLSENDINIDYIYTLASGNNSALIAIKTWDMNATEEILLANKIKIVTLENMD